MTIPVTTEILPHSPRFSDFGGQVGHGFEFEPIGELPVYMLYVVCIV